VKFVDNLLGIPRGETCVVHGTLYKEMPMKPSIIKELAEKADNDPQPIQTRYVSQDDVIILEDESGRVVLSGESLPVNFLFTGVVVAFKGRSRGSDFVVEDFCWPGLAGNLTGTQSSSQPQRLLSPSTSSAASASQMPDANISQELQLPFAFAEKGSFIVLCSDLRFGAEEHFPQLALARQILLDVLVGRSANPASLKLASRMTSLLVSGGLYAPPPPAAYSFGNLVQRTDDTDVKERVQSCQTWVSAADRWLYSLLSFMPVDIMPACGEPTTFMLPQAPLHPCLFGTARKFASLTLSPNPYTFTLSSSLTVLTGSSGEPLHDIAKYCEISEPLQALEDTLVARHMAPTAPDTLPAFPFVDEDPFVLEQVPHVYFAGRQPAFATKLVAVSESEHVRLITIPSFCLTHSVVLLNTESLEAVEFTIQL
jgi:DNA polymerase delta subunit 2